MRIVRPKKGKGAQVINIRFLGEAALLEIGIQGMEQPLLARVRGDEAPPVGAEIGVTIDPASTMIFERTRR